MPCTEEGLLDFREETATHSSLENPRDGRAWWAAVPGVAQGLT